MASAQWCTMRWSMLLKPFELEQRDLTAADIPDILQKSAGRSNPPAAPGGRRAPGPARRWPQPRAGPSGGTRLIRKYLESLPSQPGVLPLRIAAQEKPMAGHRVCGRAGPRPRTLPVRMFGPRRPHRCAARWPPPGGRLQNRPRGAPRAQPARHSKAADPPPTPWRACSASHRAAPTRCASSGSTASCSKATLAEPRAARLGGSHYEPCAKSTKAC